MYCYQSSHSMVINYIIERSCPFTKALSPSLNGALQGFMEQLETFIKDGSTRKLSQIH